MKRRTKEGEAAWKGFEDLRAWQLARQLMTECHKLADALPAKERYDLATQIRRSSKSVMANIAEGYGRYHYLDSLRFYYIARGSLDETINHNHSPRFGLHQRCTLPRIVQLGARD